MRVTPTMMMTLIMSTLVTHNCATPVQSDTSQLTDVKRSFIHYMGALDILLLPSFLTYLLRVD